MMGTSMPLDVVERIALSIAESDDVDMRTRYAVAGTCKTWRRVAFSAWFDHLDSNSRVFVHPRQLTKLHPSGAADENHRRRVRLVVLERDDRSIEIMHEQTRRPLLTATRWRCGRGFSIVQTANDVVARVIRKDVFGARWTMRVGPPRPPSRSCRVRPEPPPSVGHDWMNVTFSLIESNICHPRQLEMRDALGVLTSVTPRFRTEDNTWALDFVNVVVPSSKNFQMRDGAGSIAVEFGRTTRPRTFVVEFDPGRLTAVQAFALALSAIGWKWLLPSACAALWAKTFERRVGGCGGGVADRPRG